MLEWKCVDDNGAGNDNNTGSNSLEQDICPTSSDNLMIFSNSLEHAEITTEIYLE